MAVTGTVHYPLLIHLSAPNMVILFTGNMAFFFFLIHFQSVNTKVSIYILYNNTT